MRSVRALCVCSWPLVSLAGTKWYRSVSCNPGYPGFTTRSACVSMKNEGLDAMNFTNAMFVGANTVSGFVGLA